MEPLSRDGLIERLVDCGLAERSAQLYVHLLSSGAQSATEIAQATGAHRNQVYRDMEALTQQGFAVQTVERPTRFVPAPPQAVLDTLKTDLERMDQKLHHFADEAVPALEKLAKQAAPVENEIAQMRHVNGRKEMLDETVRMLARAQKEVRFLLTHPEAVRIAHMGGLWPLLWTAARRGLAIRGIVSDSLPLRGLLENIPGPAKVRTLETQEAMHVVLIDGKEILITAAMDPAQTLRATQDQGLWTDAKAMVPVMEAAFEHYWQAAKQPKLERPPRPPSMQKKEAPADRAAKEL